MSDLSPQLIEQVCNAGTDGYQLNIIGRNSKAFMGRQAIGEPINLAGHQGIVDYQPAELVLTARAGTSLEEIESALTTNKQQLAFEPPHFGDASIGGTLACNLSGPARPWAGSIRDAVLGIRLINGKGEHLRFGGQVMKNVAGYDASRLQAGAMGCLGIITEVSLKVMPAAACSQTLSMPLADPDEAISLMNQLSASTTPINGASWHGGKLHLRLQGAEAAVYASRNQLQAKLKDVQIADDGGLYWSQLREQQLDFFTTSNRLWRFSVESNLAHLLPAANWLIDWGGAQRWLAGDFQLDQLVDQLPKGQVSGFRGMNKDKEVFHPQSAAAKALHQRLKHAFDPAGIFNSGRLYSWL
jgi:glycolate oxidase FAD binding subunit